MAELQIIPEARGGYDSGDILNSFNNRNIKCIHAQECCNPNSVKPNADGYLDRKTHIEAFCRITRRYQMKVLSGKTLQIRDYKDGSVREVADEQYSVLIDNTPETLVSAKQIKKFRKKLRSFKKRDYDGQVLLGVRASNPEIAVLIAATRSGMSISDTTLLLRKRAQSLLVFNNVQVGYTYSLVNPEIIDLEMYIKRRRAHKRKGRVLKPIFGSFGKEVWYSGSYDFSNNALDQVWDKIEEHTPRLRGEEDFAYWPFGSVEKKTTLLVPIDDIDDETCKELHSSVSDNLGQTIQKRKNSFEWERVLDTLKVTKKEVLDYKKSIDRRKESTNSDHRPFTKTKKKKKKKKGS